MRAMLPCLVMGVVACSGPSAHSTSSSSGGTTSGSGTSGSPEGYVTATHRRFPFLPDNGGPVLSSMTLVTIVASNDQFADSLQAFGDDLIHSAWWSTVGPDYGLGPPQASLHLTGPAIASDMDATTVVAYIEGVIAARGPKPNGQTMYLLYLPDGIGLSDALPPVCAYHSAFPSKSTTLGDAYGAAWHTLHPLRRSSDPPERHPRPQATRSSRPQPTPRTTASPGASHRPIRGWPRSGNRGRCKAGSKPAMPVRAR